MARGARAKYKCHRFLRKKWFYQDANEKTVLYGTGGQCVSDEAPVNQQNKRIKLDSKKVFEITSS